MHANPGDLKLYHVPEPAWVCAYCHQPITLWQPDNPQRGGPFWVHDDGELDMWCKVRVVPEAGLEPQSFSVFDLHKAE